MKKILKAIKYYIYINYNITSYINIKILFIL
jgi:hypothetical protein